MGNMLRNQSNAGSHCSCCNDPYRDNPRAFEKRIWKKELEDEKDAIYKQGLIADIEGNKNYEEWE